MTANPRRTTFMTRGFSLIELMVAMAISLLLLAGVIAIFASSRSSYETTEKMSRIQESGRFAVDQFTHDIRSAGFVGCSRAPTTISSSLDPSNVLYDFIGGPVRGYQYTSGSSWAPALPNVGLPTTILPGSDVLALRLPARDVAPLKMLNDLTTGAEDIVLENTPGVFKNGDIAILYSCAAEAYFQVTSISGGVVKHTDSGLNNSATVYFPFPARYTEALPVNTVFYFVKAKSGTDPTPVLARKIGTEPVEDLIDGVEQMQIDYGLDTNSDNVVDNYVTANAITDWRQVFSVRVALLVRSMEQYGTDKDERDHKLLTGANMVTVTAPNDRYYRQVFTSTVTIRNKAVIN